MANRLSRGKVLVGSIHPSAQTFTDITVAGEATIDTAEIDHLAGDHFAVTAPLLAASVDNWAFVAPAACALVAVKEIHSVVGGSSAAVRPRKVTAVTTPGASAGANVIELTGAFDLTATVNTVVSGTVVTAGGANEFAAGDALGLDFSGTLTGLVGSLTFWFKTLPEA